jgi:hypothetical protein
MSAFGASWRVTLRTKAVAPPEYGDGDGSALVVTLDMLSPPPEDAAATFLTLPPPPGAAGAAPGGRLLPLNIVLEFAGGVFLDSHAAFALGGGESGSEAAAVAAAAAPGAVVARCASWSHFVWWSHIARGELRVHLQACEVVQPATVGA